MRRFNLCVSEGVSLAQSEYFFIVRFPISVFGRLNDFAIEILNRVSAYRLDVIQLQTYRNDQHKTSVPRYYKRYLEHGRIGRKEVDWVWMSNSRVDERISLYLLLSRWACLFNGFFKTKDISRSPRTASWTFPSFCLLEKMRSSSIKQRIWASILLCSIHIILLGLSFGKSREGDRGTGNGKTGFAMCQGLSMFHWNSFFKLKGCSVVVGCMNSRRTTRLSMKESTALADALFIITSYSIIVKLEWMATQA